MAPETSVEVQSNENLPSVEEKQVRQYLNKQHAEVQWIWWDGPKSAEGAGWRHCKTTHIYLWNLMVIGGGLWGLEESKCHSFLQEREEGVPKELQTCQLHLDPWEGYTENSSQNISKILRIG